MDLGLRGKYALVTGGTHGIGKNVALALAEEGCNIAICSRNLERVKQTVTEIKDKEVEVIGIRADVTSKRDTARVMAKIIDKWKTIHILVNNVGGGGRWGQENIETTDEEVWKEVYDKNVISAIRFINLSLPYMRKQKWGRVVTITSLYGKEIGGRPWFNLAKVAQTVLMKNLSLKTDLVRQGITFNSIAPGCIMIPDTGWDKEQKSDPAGFKKMVAEKFPLGRLGTPEEVASIVVFTCSERASLLNGASIPADGGESKNL
jgi:3-oxoacyl-[acyl-carrier protein] reductase